MTRCRLAVRLLRVTALLCSSATALLPQARPPKDTAVARARATWLTQLAAACDTLVVDPRTLRPVTVPQSNVPLRLPQSLLEHGDILSGSFYDSWPREPAKRYELFQFDPVTMSLMLVYATAVIHCPPSDPTAARIWVFGFESSAFAKPTIRERRHVLGAWDHDPHRLYGLSRDLWGAQAFVTAMRRRVVPPDSARSGGRSP